jgi:hypothetical protein
MRHKCLLLSSSLLFLSVKKIPQQQFQIENREKKLNLKDFVACPVALSRKERRERERENRN